MIEYVTKRNGSRMRYDANKIKNAILKAAISAGLDEEFFRGHHLNELVDEVEKMIETYVGNEIPNVEDIQDFVEIALMHSNFSMVAKKYILYRNLHAKYRNQRQLIDDLMDTIDSYLDMSNWRVNENSNMGFSLQGLNNHISSEITGQYWLNEIYPEEIRQRHINGDLHIHDLSSLSVYCCGWDVQDLLLEGFSGVTTKVESKPPKHFQTALMQIVNFLYTLQGEASGAQAFSNFDTYLAPFIHYDNLSYKEVYQCMQEFIFNLNVPTRVGFQCMSEDTEILTPDGWKKYNEVEVGDTIKTFNLKKKVIEDSTVNRVFRRHYEGEMYNLKNRIQDQLISPKHRVVKKVNNSDKYILQPIEEVAKMKSPAIIPVGANNNNPDIDLSNEQIRLIAWLISDGSLEKVGNYKRITLYKSKIKYPNQYEWIRKTLDDLGIDYKVQSGSKSLGEEVNQIRFNAGSTKEILGWFDEDSIKEIPTKLLNASQKQSEEFIEAYLNEGDGSPDENKLYTTSTVLVNQLQQVIANAGWGSTVLNRGTTEIGNKDVYVIRIIKHQDTYISEIDKINYNGIIWCPNTDNETVIARRNGKVFITGNTPFTNITMDLNCPSTLKNEPAIIGGKPQDKMLNEFQNEMDMLNKAFAEIMLEGDSKGRVFSFPIPTYNITNDFNWDNDVYNPIWEMTAKYGIPYFSNFINSDMSPDDVRSMCPLDGKEKVLVKTSKNNIRYSQINHVYHDTNDKDVLIYSDGDYVKGHFNKFDNQEMIEVKLVNGHNIKMSKNHLNYVIKEKNGDIEEITGNELKEGFYLPYSLNSFRGNGGTYDLGYLIGCFAGDGSYDKDTGVVFSLNNSTKLTVLENLKEILSELFGANYTETICENNVIKLSTYSPAVRAIMEQFVSGNNALNKHYNARVFEMSKHFRTGLFDGHYDTDGSNRNRIYTSSEKMVESLNMLAATLGTTTSIYKDNRTKEDGKLSNNVNYAVLFYKLNRNSYGDVWFKKDSKLWMKIDSVKYLETTQTAYCFEVENNEPIFTVGTTGILTHNCRLRLDNTELRKRGGSLFGSNPMTGSIGVVTLNMPRIGLLATSKEDYLDRVYELMDIAKESLEIKRRVLERFTEAGLYPYSKFYLRNVKKRFDNYWQNHFNTIGINGMNESVLNFLGKDLSDPESIDFTEYIMDKMKERMVEYQEETGDMFNLEATPAEGTSYRFAKLDKENRDFEDRPIFANNDRVWKENADPYYTNSTQLPVGFTDDPFEALELQDSLQTRYTGGTVLHLFLGERMPSIESTKKLVKRVAENFSLSYYSITPTFSVCPIHGYLSGEHEFCPKCDAEKSVLNEST